MPRWGIIVAALVVAVLVATQVLVPSLAARKVEQRLTEGGGGADVRLGAVPALRLLFGNGERFEVDAHDLDLELEQDTAVFDRLDGFGIVEIDISNLRAGPFRLDSFELSRDAPGPYVLSASGDTSPAALVDFGISSLDLPGGPFAGLALETLFDDTDVQIPLDLDIELTSDEGRVEVISGGGTVAGFPTGPLAELITSAIVVRL